MIPHNNTISEYKSKYSDSKVMTLEKSNVANFFREKKLILEQNPDTIITDCLPDEMIVCFDKNFAKELIEKGVFIKNCALQKGKILSFIRLNDKSLSLIEKVTEVQIDFKESVTEKEIISHEFILFDLNTISEIKNFHTIISIKTKIILVSKVLPDYLENIIYPDQLIHIQAEELSIRLLVKIITNDFNITRLDTYVSDEKINSNFSTSDELFHEIKVSDIFSKDSTWNDKQNQEFKKYKILNLLENQNTDTIPDLCDIIISEINHIPIKILLSYPEIKKKDYLIDFWNKYNFCKYFLKFNKILKVDDEKLKDSINLITGKEIKDNYINNIYDLKNLKLIMPYLLTKKVYYIHHIVKDYNIIPKDVFNIDIKEIESIKSFPLLSLFFYYRSDEIIELSSLELSKVQPIIKFFTYFRFSKNTDTSQLNLPIIPNNFDLSLDPISLCLQFATYHEFRTISLSDENTIINKILKFILTGNSIIKNNCYFTNSLFLFFASRCRDDFFKDQLNLTISKSKLCPERLNFFVKILENFELQNLS